MRYYFLEGTFQEGRSEGPEFKKALDAHHAYLKPLFESGKILTSGPKTFGGGGIILIKLEDSEKIEDFCGRDPFVKAGVQEYRVVEFKVFEIQKYAKEWVEHESGCL